MIDNAEFRARLSWAIAESPFKTHAALARASGFSDVRLISRIFTNPDKNVPHHVIARLCGTLHVSADFLLSTGGRSEVLRASDDTRFETAGWIVDDAIRRASQTLTKPFPSIDQLLSGWRASQKSLDCNESLRRFCDLYKEPDATDEVLTCIELGRESLAALTLGSLDPNDMDDFIGRFPEQRRRASITRHREICATMDYCLSSQTLTMPQPSGEIAIAEYDVLKLPVYGPGGSKMIMNFTKLAGPPQIATDSVKEVV